MRDKVAIHRKHGTNLICTCSQYNDGRELLEHLREKLESFGFVLNPRAKIENAPVLNYVVKRDDFIEAARNVVFSMLP